jgi:tetratricopeptide (TPR) repeat protein
VDLLRRIGELEVALRASQEELLTREAAVRRAEQEAHEQAAAALTMQSEIVASRIALAEAERAEGERSTAVITLKAELGALREALAERDWGLAAQLYRKALDRDPRDLPIWVQYGHALKEAGELRDPEKLAQAETAYRRALSLDPRIADTHLQLGHVLKLQGKIEDAQAAYLRASVVTPSASDPLDALCGLGWSRAEVSELRTLIQPAAAEAPSSNSGDGSSAYLGAVVAGSHTV